MSRCSTSTRSPDPARRGSSWPATGRARPRRPSSQTASRRDHRADRGEGRSIPGVLAQLVDLGFPFTLYEQGPFVARGIPAITLTSSREPARAVVRRQRRAASTPASSPSSAGRRRRRSARSTGPRARAGDDELRLVRRPHRARLGDRARPDRPAGAVLRRRPSISSRCAGASGSGSAARRGRCGRGSSSGCSSGSFSRVFPRSGRGPRGRRGLRTPNRPPPATGTSLALTLMLVIVAAAGSSRGGGSCRAGRSRRRSSSPATPSRCWRSGSCRCSSSRRTPSRCSSCCRRSTPGSGCRRFARRALAVRLAIYVAGLAGVALLVLSFAWRFGLGLDTPWYLLTLVSVGYVKTTPRRWSRSRRPRPAHSC